MPEAFSFLDKLREGLRIQRLTDAAGTILPKLLLTVWAVAEELRLRIALEKLSLREELLCLLRLRLVMLRLELLNHLQTGLHKLANLLLRLLFALSKLIK